MVRLLNLAVLLSLVFSCSVFADEPFRVDDVFPGHKTQDVELEPLIQIHVNDKFDPASVTDHSIQLLQLPAMQRVVVSITGDLGGVITLSVEEPLALATDYELKVTNAVKSRKGVSLEPLAVRFRTTGQKPKPPRSDLSLIHI